LNRREPIASEPWEQYFADLRAGRIPPTDGRHWYSDILTIGVDAVLNTAHEIARTRDLTKCRANLLATISASMTTRIRAALLLRCLERTNWNLTHAAQVLQMGTHPSVIIREIRTLGLDAEYARAQRGGRVFRSGHRTRSYVRDVESDRRALRIGR
jgi:hypothetical protein